MTCFGINNEGELVFDFWHEDCDIVNNETVYNGQNSTLWVNFREAFPDKIKETYQNLRNNKLITYDKFIEYFIYNGSDMWSASVYNEDSEYKYISMLKSDNDASNLYQVRGTGEEHLKYFIENRLNYCDSKWYASDYADDYVALRVYTPTTWAGVEPNPSITVTPFSNMYAGVRYKANGTLLQQRAEKNVPVTFSPPSGTDLTYSEDFSDTESAIYGASQISSLGDLAPLYCGTLNVSKATKLIDLKIGDSTEGYVNEHLHSLSIGTNKLLKTINVCNCPKLTSELALSECPNIEEIYATGSGITGVALANSGFLKIMRLPATITSFVLKNQHYIEILSFEGYDSIETLWIENCPTIDEIGILSHCTNVKRVRLTNVDWAFDDTSFLYSLKERGLFGIDENNTNTTNAWIDGKCHITSLTGEEMAELNSLYPYLKITYDNLTTQLIFMSDDGETELCRQTINNGGDGVDPITNGTISTPTKTSTAQYSYTFAGWSKEIGGSVAATALSSVTADRYVYAVFTATVRTYTVTFYNGSTLLQTVNNVPYGGSASYTGSTPVKTGVDTPEDYEFTGWSPSPSNITGATSCYAQYKYTGYAYVGLVERTLSGEYVDSTITSIGDYAFYGCTDLTSVDCAEVTEVGESAFYNCDSLADVNLPKATTLGETSFSSCSGLNNINIPLVETINTSAFSSSSFDKIVCQSAKTVGYNAFAYNTSLQQADFYVVETMDSAAFSNCSKLSTLIIRSETMCSVEYNSSTELLRNTAIASGNGYIYVPSALVDTYKADDDWSTYADQIRAIEDYPEILYAVPSWEAVNYHIEQGDYATAYSIGDTIPLDLGDEGTVNMQIVAFDADDLADGSGKAHISFVAKESLKTNKRMNPAYISGTEGTGGIGGWEKSEMRTYLNDTILPLIPENVSSMIKPVTKYSDGYDTSDGAVDSSVTIDSVWIPSVREIYGGTNYETIGVDYTGLFVSNTNRIKNKIGSSSGYIWWTRTAYSKNSFRCVNTNGSMNAFGNDNTFGVVLCFCM